MTGGPNEPQLVMMELATHLFLYAYMYAYTYMCACMFVCVHMYETRFFNA